MGQVLARYRAFTGYTGASFTDAIRLTTSPWAHRDIVQVANIAGDEAVDLVYRSDTSGRLLLRQGKKNTSGKGTDLNSLASAANSATGADSEYGSSGWESSKLPIVTGTPDITGDNIPDMFALILNGDVRLYPGGVGPRTRFTIVGSTYGTTWVGHTAIG